MTSSAEMVIDDRDTGFEVGGEWQHDTNHGYQNQTFWACVNADTGSAQTNWYTQIPAAGGYEVFAFIPELHSNTLNALYQIDHSLGSSTVYLAQQPYANQWVSLGKYQFDTGASAFVT